MQDVAGQFAGAVVQVTPSLKEEAAK